MAVDTNVVEKDMQTVLAGVDALKRLLQMMLETTLEVTTLEVKLANATEKIGDERMQHLVTLGELGDAQVALANMTRERDALLEMLAAKAQPSVP